MIDFTKETKLKDALQKKYEIAQTILYFVFFIATCFLAYRILFPIISLTFFMDNPNSIQNTIASPRIQNTGEFPKKGLIESESTLVFDATPIGQFSATGIKLTLHRGAENIEGAATKIRKSYQAFFYPTGEPIGFSDSSLLTTPNNGLYYIISDGKARKFVSPEIILALGYPKSAFIEISENDLKYNQPGSDVSDTLTYPNDSLFAIEDTYYKIKNGILFPYISTRAFLSQFNQAQAIAKNKDFLTQHPVSDKYLGFGNGTLGSATNSVFILTEDKSFPVADAETFNQMGLSWNDVIPLSQDELSIYSKEKQFTVSNPHPNGTIFMDQKTNDIFLIKNGFKLPVPNETILKTYSKQTPILIDLIGSEIENVCIMQNKFLSSNTYKCELSLETLANLIGNDYQINVKFPSKTSISEIQTTFSTPLNWQSLKNSLSKIKMALQNR